MDEILNSKPPSPCPLPTGERGRVRGGDLKIEFWNLFGIWGLEFGI